MPVHISGLPPPSRAAFLLDFDGTLVDIASTPDQVVVADGLAQKLARLRALCGGALAIVSGRPIAQIDALLGDEAFAVAGEHGTAIRHAPGAPIETMAIPDPPAHWLQAAHRLVDETPGSLFEPKRHGFVLHYRAAPGAGPALKTALLGLLSEQPDRYRLLAAKMAWEIAPSGVDKATAVRALMQRAPFTGRLPIFVGDDITDEDGMREARAQGGLGLRVPDIFDDAAGVRAWIAHLSEAAKAGDSWPA
jgi:trehalose 6-phosphate phosphatase